MVKFSVCLEPLLSDLELCDRIKVAADIGFQGVEIWDPIGKNVDKIGKKALESGIPVIGCCLLDQWGIRANAETSTILKNLEKTIDFASAMDCKSFILLTGDVETKFDTQKSTLIYNLLHMTEIAEKRDVTLMLEPLNSYVDHKGYYLDSAHVGFEIVRAVDSKRVKLLYDCYHMQIMEGNLIDTMTKNISHIGHVHCAGVPGRNEIFNGEINYNDVIKNLDKIGYDHYVGVEYWPTYDDIQSLRDTIEYLKG